MINPLSLSSFKIEMLGKNYETEGNLRLGTATAFFYDFKDQIYLITNWHNITGKNALTNQPLNQDSALPHSLSLYLHYSTQMDNGDSAVFWDKTYILDLYDRNDEDNVPIWYEHPIHGCKVDVVAIPLEETVQSLKDKGIAVVPVNCKSLQLFDFQIFTGMDAFLLGYPLGLVGGGQLPIWKRGSVASELIVDIDKLPKYLIDTATTKTGMSGSPIFIKCNGFTIPKGKTGIEEMIMPSSFTFGGIYSGRTQLQYYGENIFPDLAIAWKETAIIEIIEGQKKSEYKFYG
ncbi:serine protease family protein [Acinetobacter calcoaceticus]|uniref:trypsin-like peptidase domain-containing protein n=1 Tax=Acinetobacter calcoaceticus TaxID=471 RepID=UPI0005E83D93|nr:trypsin-like peptidase domain-containing protein [Acinetobacter calcoaceticus]KJH62118.1 hypothetical protein UF12_09650 [Acinetobacter calcoaceticus]